jgi:uncharacterized protein (UPF0332 family)
MILESYLSNRWLKAHTSSAQEIADLLAIADRDIEQSQTPGLAAEWRFDIAYNSALQSATAALAAAGYLAGRQNKHSRTIECLEFTIGLDRKSVGFLEQCRRKRHTAVYEQVGAVSDQEAEEMLHAAKELRREVAKWIRSHHSELLR